MTLRTRLTLAVAGIVAAAVLAGAGASVLTTERELRREVDRFLLERARRFDGRPQGGDGGPGPGPGLGPAGRPPVADLDAVSQVIGGDGAIRSSIAGQPELPVDDTDRRLAAEGGGERLRTVTVDGARYRMLTRPLPRGGAIQVARTLGESDQVVAALRRRLLAIAAAGIVAAGAAGWLLARRTTRPVEHLTSAAERIAATEDLTTPIPVRGGDEVGRLAASFNTMLSALSTSRAQQHRLVADASHELRTPLTALRTNIEFLERADPVPDGERQALLAEARLELAELTDLVTELVELATDARADEPVVAVDLGDLADDVVARFRRRSGRDISLSLDDPAVIDGRRAMLERAVSNLVDNALKFSDGPVEVSVHGRVVEVADRGVGLSDDDRTRVFDRFYRAEGARTRPGSGLGLSIVAQIAATHAASVALDARPGGGTVARLTLPG